jgi:cell division control protein 6
VLEKLFGWAARPGSRLVLLGIANALDLTHRFLPILHARGCAPELLPFLPYQVSSPLIFPTTLRQSSSGSSCAPELLSFLPYQVRLGGSGQGGVVVGTQHPDP